MPMQRTGGQISFVKVFDHLNIGNVIQFYNIQDKLSVSRDGMELHGILISKH